MKQCAILLSCLGSLLLAPPAQAQNYRPFRFGLSYQLNASTTPGDTTHLLRLASRQTQGGDSLFLFDQRTSRGRALPQQGNCGQLVRRTDNLFGTSLRLRPGAEYVLAAANGRTLSLRPRAPLGQAWPAAAGLTAQVTARTLGTVLGQPDSLATISFSNGAVLVLSKRFGWVSGPGLGHYLNARLPQAPLTLTALPELGLGTSRFGAWAVYDFQPGDVFLRKTETRGYGPGGACFTETWERDSIISRVLSANGDTLRYQQRHRTLVRNCNAAAPVLSASVVQTLRILRTAPGFNQVTGFWATTATSSNGGMVHLPAWRTANYFGRSVQGRLGYLRCGSVATPDSTSLFDSGTLDAGYHEWTAPGLGQTMVESISFTSETTTLLGYRKGPETWGQLTTFAQLLAARDSRPASTTAAFPNPFGAELKVAFTLTRGQAVAVVLRDALGRLVLERAASFLPAGPQQLELVPVGLPVGVYSLHLRFVQDNRTEVLRVAKTE